MTTSGNTLIIKRKFSNIKLYNSFLEVLGPFRLYEGHEGKLKQTVDCILLTLVRVGRYDSNLRINIKDPW